MSTILLICKKKLKYLIMGSKAHKHSILVQNASIPKYCVVFCDCHVVRSSPYDLVNRYGVSVSQMTTDMFRLS